MKRIKQWLKNKKDAIKKSRTFLAIVMLAIGVSYTVCFYEGSRLYHDYNEAIDYWNDYQIRKAEKEVVIINVAEAKTEEKKVDVDGILDKIQMLESSGGVNDDKCERIGGHNSYGFGQGNGRNFCLASDKDMRVKVKEWLEKNLEVYGLNKTLCLYNTGNLVDSCEYVDNYNTL